MDKIKTIIETRLDLDKKREIITGKILYKGEIIILYKAEIINGKIKML